jgi:hypothetical protein
MELFSLVVAVLDSKGVPSTEASSSSIGFMISGAKE